MDKPRTALFGSIAFVAVIVMIALALAPGRDRTEAAIDLLSVLGPDRPEASVDLDPERYVTARELGERDGFVYFAALDEAKEICFITRRGAIENGVAAVSCTAVEDFAQHGIGVGQSASGARSIAYLLPDGYTESAAGLDWGELVGRNVVVVEDFDAYQAATVTTLEPADGRHGTLELKLLSPS